jgi:DNA-binding response OmpR family regulator
MYVMIISKNNSFRKQCIDHLVNRGHVAVGVASFAEGERTLQKAQPDAIVICPGGTSPDGEITTIRNHYRLRTTPILLVGADREHLPAQKVHQAHAVYPVDSRYFFSALTSIMAH